MRAFSSKYAQDIYVPELFAILDEGDDVDVRGRKTVELLDVYTEILEPWHHCILIPERRWNPWIALSEFLWIMAGRRDVEALRPYNQNIGDYSDDGKTLYGAYGWRMFGQIDALVERLRKDPSDRRAVLSIWEAEDLTANTKDPPCNDMVMF